jgi:hypothetical protein
MLAAFRNAARKVKNTEYTGGDSPSSGLIALNYLLQVCDRVAVYGLSSERSSSDESSTWPYHYFAFKQFPMVSAASLLVSGRVDEIPTFSAFNVFHYYFVFGFLSVCAMNVIRRVRSCRTDQVWGSKSLFLFRGQKEH